MYGSWQGSGLVEKPTPKPGPYDALVRPLAIAPCSSDVHNAYEIGSPAFLNERILGHEALAEVVEVGSEVKDFKAGDRIVVPAVTPDWHNPSIEDSYHQHTKAPNDSFKYAFSLDGLLCRVLYCAAGGYERCHVARGDAAGEGCSWPVT